MIGLMFGGGGFSHCDGYSSGGLMGHPNGCMPGGSNPDFSILSSRRVSSCISSGVITCNSHAGDLQSGCDGGGFIGSGDDDLDG
jgi:hypothetical protein